MLYQKLLDAKIGVGPATITKLDEAGLKTAEAILAAGLDGLRAIKVFPPIAGKILEVALANPTPATEIEAASAPIILHPDDAAKVAEVAPTTTKNETPAVLVKRQTVFAAKLEEAAKANGTTVEELRAAAKANVPAEKPVVVTHKTLAKPENEHVNFIDVGIETPTEFTSPVRLRDFFDKLPKGQVPDSARYIKNLFPVCAMCRAAGSTKTLQIDHVHVLVVTRLDGSVNSGLFCDDHITVAYGQAKDLVKDGKLKEVKIIWLREAWANLTRAYRAQVDEAREERYRKERADRRTAALRAVMEDLGSVTSEHWMTDEQLGSYVSPMDVPVFTCGLEAKQARELHLLPNDKEKGTFKGRWGRFYDEYGIRLVMRPPQDLTQHNTLVQHLRDDAKAAQATPFFPVVLVRRYFGDDLGWRYLAIHELVIEEFVATYEQAHNFKVRTGAMAYEWLTRRWEVQREEAAKAAAQAFAKSDEGKALNAFLNAAPDDEAAADSALLAGSAHKK